MAAFALDRRKPEQGVALVLTLGILALVTMLLIAFVTSMRVENMSSKNYNDLIKARQLAQAAVDTAVANIRIATPPIINSPLTTYVTSPGAIYTYNLNGNGTWTMTPMYTMPVTGNPTDTNDLNAGYWITGTNPAPLGTYVPLTVGWSNIVANGQLVGRFAYWVDDESAKININTAYSRLADLEGWTPAAIDLQALFVPLDPMTIWNFVQFTRPFDTLDSLKQVTSINQFPVKFTTNRFYMTVNSSSPDLTPWGTKRLNLTSLVNTAQTPLAAMNGIVNALTDPGLTAWFGKDFSSKYNNNLQQIAANIVGYINATNTPIDSGAGGNIFRTPQYLGLEQTPYINELVISNMVSVPPLTGPSAVINFSSSIIVELWYMYTNTLGWPNNAVVQFTGNPMPSITVTQAPTGVTCGSVILQPATINYPPMPASPAPNSYMALPSPLQPSSVTVSDTSTPIIVQLNAGTITAVLLDSSGNRLDYASIYVQPTNTPPFMVNNPAGVQSFYLNWVSACNDPRVKPVSNNWTPLRQGQETLGLPNTYTTNMQVQTGSIQGDGDISCHVVSGNIPESLLTGARDRGNMYPGEMSFIHTGVPWRTFWLQHKPAGEPAPPDWAVLDLFSATDTTNVVGRMNLNQWISTDNSISIFPPRLTPLVGLLTNSLLSDPNFGTITAMSSINRQPPLLFYTPGFPFSVNAFTWVGQVCEVQGLVDQAPSSYGSIFKAVRETPARGIANLVTTRSDMFTVWAIAQSAKKIDTTNPTVFISGTDVITGEAKVQAIVQRYEDPSYPLIDPRRVKFRTLYYRYWYQ